MTFNFIKWATLLEDRQPKTLALADLPYGRKELAPAISEETIDYHYGKLAKAYVDRYNKGEGDRYFNESGAFLHNIFFPQLRTPKNANVPTGASLALINRHFGTFTDFKKQFEEEAMKLQGSNWIYLSRSGQIKTIKNHVKRTDIALLIDWWEHAWVTDYGSDKKRYLKNMWRHKKAFLLFRQSQIVLALQ
jgi:Fe-Mn family superoxide dismutase